MLQATLVVTGVVVARALGPVDRGHFGLIAVVVLVAWQLGGQGLPYALTYLGAKMPHALSGVLSRERGLILALAAVTTLGSAVALLALTLDDQARVQIAALLGALVAGPILLYRIALGVLQGLRRFRSFNALRVAPNLAFAAASSVILWSGRTSLVLVVATWGACQLIAVPYAWRKATAEARAAQDWERTSREAPGRAWVLSFGRRALFGAAPPMEMYKLDQLVVAVLLAPAALGYYVVALALTNLPRFMAQSIGIVAAPTVARQRTARAARLTAWQHFALSIPLCGALVGAIALMAPEIIRVLFGETFSPAIEIARVLMVSTFFYCARQVLSDGLRGAGFPGLGSIAEGLGLVVALPLMIWLVSGSGALGVAYALAFSSAVALAFVLGALIVVSARGIEPADWDASVSGDQHQEASSPQREGGVDSAW